MATAAPQPQSAFHLQAPEDDMEISSDFGRDQDIDIDLDVENGFTPRPPDEDMMQDDVRSQAEEFLGRDDLMLDHSADQVEDGMMADDQEDFTFVDEHLTDVSEPVFADNNLEDETLVETMGEDPAQDFPFENIPNLDTAQETLDDSTITATVIEENPHVESSEENVDTQNTETLNPDPVIIVTATEEEQAHIEEPETTEPSASADPQDDHDNIAQSELPKQLSEVEDPDVDVDVNTLHEPDSAPNAEEVTDTVPQPQDSTSLQDEANEQDTQESWHTNQAEPLEDNKTEDDDNDSSFQDLHPVVVLYDGNILSLFPPQNPDLPEQFFLQDESYALKSVGDLLQACREVLGHTINEEEELQLSISTLGLTIKEVHP